VIEILERLDVLAKPVLDVRTLRLGGVPYGSTATDTIPRYRIKRVTHSPVAYQLTGGAGKDTEYFGHDGQRLTFDTVVDSALEGDGVVHFADRTSCQVTDGKVVGFALYGGNRSHLSHFDYLRSYDEFLAAFGTPDQVKEHRAFGDVLGYQHYFRGTRKRAYWDGFEGRLSSVSLGAHVSPSAHRP
jgi:hypothetical protein